ncbi:MAG: hypothetical protein AAGK77_03980 [Pseudomonadota bacterium]
MSNPTSISASRQRVIDDLLVLIRKHATEALLDEVSYGDSYASEADVLKHRAALNTLRDQYEWRLVRQPGNTWYPSEPIELIAYAVDGGSTVAEMFCNALLLIAELEGSEYDYMGYRWFQTPGEAWFRALEDPWRTALLNGFAVLHAESNALEREFWASPDANGSWIEPPEGWHD